MRRSVVVLVAFGVFSSVTFASQPGQPMDCSDFVPVAPGFTCREEIVCGRWGNGWMDTRCQWAAISQGDSEGGILYWRGQPGGIQEQCEGGVTGGWIWEIVRLRNRAEEIIGRFPQERCGTPGTYDQLRPTPFPAAGIATLGAMQFDPIGGRLFLMIETLCWTFSGYGSPYELCAYGDSIPGGLGERRIIVIEGFTTLFDVIDSYVPAPSNFGFRVPHRPEGLRTADRFDTYSGEVTRPLDLSQAQPLQCNYPTSPPVPGDYLMFPAAGTPAPGHARYYLTTVTYQGQTRAGRQALDGRLSGRDASRLPMCETVAQRSGDTGCR